MYMVQSCFRYLLTGQSNIVGCFLIKYFCSCEPWDGSYNEKFRSEYEGVFGWGELTLV